MNKFLMSILLISLCSGAWAQNNNGNQQDFSSGNGSNNNNRNNNQNGQQPQLTQTVKSCMELKTRIAQQQAMATGPAAKLVPTSEGLNCQALSHLAKQANSGLESSPEAEATSDRKIVCTRKAGYTIDYDSCTSAIKMYNYIKIAEASLTVTESVQSQRNVAKNQAEVSKRTAAGDGQEAAIDAVINQNTQLKEMNQTRAAAYTTAVAALGSAMAKWVSNKPETYQKLCGIGPQPAEQYNAIKAQTCPEFVAQVQKAPANEIFANNSAKNQFYLAIADFAQKGIKAGIEAGKFNNVANKLTDAKESIAENDQVTLEQCAIYPTDPVCLNASGRTPGETYQGGNFSMGSGGTNAFSMGDKSGTETTADEPTTGTPTGDERVAAINNPFSDDAKMAKDILNPAAAASVSPGGGAGGGGGGGGGVGGGGSASLGNDLKGADENPQKEAEIKASKAGGSYSASGMAGFQAVKSGKEAENPFASMFDSKADGGGIEEDRSIASESGPGSGLFQKISAKYSKIHEARRIEANNQE